GGARRVEAVGAGGGAFGEVGGGDGGRGGEGDGVGGGVGECHGATVGTGRALVTPSCHRPSSVQSAASGRRELSGRGFGPPAPGCARRTRGSRSPPSPAA